MPQGLQVFDASGNITLDLTDRVGRILGAQVITSANGSVTNVGFAGLTPFWLATPLVNFGTFSPTFSFNTSTNTLSWVWPYSGGANHQLIYGAF